MVRCKKIFYLYRTSIILLSICSGFLPSAFCASEDPVGPTIYLDYDNTIIKRNPVYDFMYFVPIISPTLVESVSSKDNQQYARIISSKRQTSPEDFSAFFEFEMTGKGSCTNTYDPESMFIYNLKNIKQGNTLKNMLEYIQFEGEGFGNIEIKGRRIDGIDLVTEMKINFNARGHKSPVTIGIYNVKPVSGEYKYKNRSNMSTARVDTVIFKNSAPPARMGVRLASLYDTGGFEQLWAVVKGKVANFFIEPIRIDDEGNKTMLDFGLTLYKGKKEFTFPKALNLKQGPEQTSLQKSQKASSIHD